MKVTINRFNYAYEIALTPETVADAIVLVDMGMNTTKEMKYTGAMVSVPYFFGATDAPRTLADDYMKYTISIGRRVRHISHIPRKG